MLIMVFFCCLDSVVDVKLSNRNLELCWYMEMYTLSWIIIFLQIQISENTHTILIK